MSQKENVDKEIDRCLLHEEAPWEILSTYFKDFYEIVFENINLKTSNEFINERNPHNLFNIF